MYRLLLFACAAAAWRDTSFFKTLPASASVPTVTNSLVNLGKMDISLYINAKPQDTFLNPISDSMDEPCPCSRDPSRSHPSSSDVLNKILHNNDLFPFREPSVSTLCCDSQEQVREDSILLEFGPKPSPLIVNPVSASRRSPVPFLLDNLIPRKPLSSQSVPTKHKFIELLLLPKKNEITLDLGKIIKKKDIHKEDNIKIVGDKELRNDFKNMKFIPPLSSSVKKDLTVQENKSKLEVDKQDSVNAVLNTSKANIV